jgi:RNA polymerase sigma-70 factor (ECF subfamily)
MIEDRLLIWKFNRGKKDILERIYSKYKDDLMTLSTALLYDKSSAEDVIHDVFVKFIHSCGKMRLNQSLKGYLITCVVNTARNKNKTSQRRDGTSLDNIAQISSGYQKPDTSLMHSENAQKLSQALVKLPYEQREVLLLHLFSSLKFKAIAEMQKESISTIQGRYRYGLNKLRSLLNGEVQNETGR